jgi:hypothetical protein
MLSRTLTPFCDLARRAMADILLIIERRGEGFILRPASGMADWKTLKFSDFRSD